MNPKSNLNNKIVKVNKQKKIKESYLKIKQLRMSPLKRKISKWIRLKKNPRQKFLKVNNHKIQNKNKLTQMIRRKLKRISNLKKSLKKLKKLNNDYSYQFVFYGFFIVIQNQVFIFYWFLCEPSFFWKSPISFLFPKYFVEYFIFNLLSFHNSIWMIKAELSLIIFINIDNWVYFHQVMLIFSNLGYVFW